jgi:hypothetical protein
VPPGRARRASCCTNLLRPGRVHVGVVLDGG